MAPFRRGKSGIQWIYIQTGPGSKQISTGTTDARLARQIDAMCKQLADEKQFELLRALVAKSKKLTIDQLLDAYRKKALDTLRAQLAAVTLADYKAGFTADAKAKAPVTWAEQVAAVTWLLERVKYAHELKPARIRDLLNQVGGTGGTKRHKLYAWSAFCRYLVAHEVLPANPCADRDLVPRPPKAKKRTEWRTADVDQAICDRLTGDTRIIAVVCAASSADRSTVQHLLVKHVHLLKPGVAPDKDKGIEHRLDLPGTKTSTRARKGVRLEPWAVPILREWIKGKLPNAPLVAPVGLQSITNAWRDAAKAEGHEGYWLRDTRHSYGCRAILAGYPLWEVSKWLGHANQAITADIYTQFDYDVARQVVAASHTTPDTTRPENLTPAKEG